NVQSVINNLRGCNLLIFHTIIIINMIAKKNHYNVKIGVNLCPTCLDGEGFNQLYKLLSQTASDNIVFELTENSGVEYTSQVIDRILKIQLLGYDIAIDDFGVGNNNISLLDSISPRFVKIDRLFVTDIENSERQVSMARNLIDIAKSHSSIIIFEGVERISQKDALTDIGGLIQQGHLYHLSEDNKS
ncbi:EAL domain-containing protein, partial [Shewanella sp. GutDb-MelDb]|uniref:EAL domain-containing protein n=1 Tax=Shewanella sp. GutDb-MelDb TaxID=2058316 RepID=UPI000CBC4FAB